MIFELKKYSCLRLHDSTVCVEKKLDWIVSPVVLRFFYFLPCDFRHRLPDRINFDTPSVGGMREISLGISGEQTSASSNATYSPDTLQSMSGSGGSHFLIDWRSIGKPEAPYKILEFSHLSCCLFFHHHDRDRPQDRTNQGVLRPRGDSDVPRRADSLSRRSMIPRIMA